MTRVVDSALLAVYQSRVKTIKEGMKITRGDGQIFRWVNHDRNVLLPETVGSPGNEALYLAAPGVQLSSIVSSEGFKPDTAQLKVLEDADITRAAILAGVWNGALFEVFQFNYKNPTSRHILKRGTIGNFKPMRGYSTVEFRDIRQAAQYSHETVLQPTCRYQLGVRNATSHCPVQLTFGSPNFTVSGTVTSVGSQYVVTDSGRTEPDDWFGEGIFTITQAGDGFGQSRKIKTYAGGVFTFWDQFIFPLVAGSPALTYTASAGCRLRFQEDCKAKFGSQTENGIAFGGEPNKRNPDTLTAPAPEEP